MFDSSSFTAGANRVIGRARARAGRREAEAAEPIDLLVALASETESLAASLLERFGLPPDRLAEVLGLGELEEIEVDERGEPSPLSPATRVVVGESLALAKSLDRARPVGTEHLLSGLLSAEAEIVGLLSGAGLRVEELRSEIEESHEEQAGPIPLDADFPPLELTHTVESVDLARMLDASANRASEGLRVVEDYVRFVLDDAGLTRRLKEVRHRLNKAVAGLGPDLLIGSRDTKGDVGTHIMTHSERVRENPRGVLTANFKRTGEALRSLEEYSKLLDVWPASSRCSATTCTRSRRW